MLKRICYKSPIGFAVFLPLVPNDNDKLSDDVKTRHDFYKKPVDNETGMDRIKIMFTVDEWGGISSEVNAMYQAGFLGFLFGAVYGGFISSRVAHDNFMNTNQATTFNSHFDAKKKLQNQVTVSFAKGAFRWGWRLALFTTSYVAITTTISVYRGKSSFVEYLTAGAVTGAAYKVNMGVRGVLVGGGLGLVLGGIAGGASLAILKASGNTMEEVRYWQYKWKLQRDQAIFESMRKQVVEDTLIDEHDVAVGTNNLSLEQLEVKPTKPNKPAPAKDKK